MCELLGFTSARNTDISDYLRTFFSHSDKNPHGWGMMYENGGRVILKEPVCASESSFLGDVIDSLAPQKSLLAHIRFATVGSINENNCHPFTGKDISIQTSSGREFPDDLSKYSLVIHCGGCMLTPREMSYRMKCASDQGVAFTNYGVAIAFMTGILKRSVEIFPHLYEKL